MSKIIDWLKRSAFWRSSISRKAPKASSGFPVSISPFSRPRSNAMRVEDILTPEQMKMLAKHGHLVVDAQSLITFRASARADRKRIAKKTPDQIARERVEIDAQLRSNILSNIPIDIMSREFSHVQGEDIISLSCFVFAPFRNGTETIN